MCKIVIKIEFCFEIKHFFNKTNVEKDVYSNKITI